MSPRPWYVTISALADRNPELALFLQYEWSSQWNRFVPFHQERMADWQQHVTTFAVVQLQEWPEAEGETAGLRLMMMMMQNCDLRAVLRNFAGFCLLPFEVCSFDSGTAIQYRSLDERVAHFREIIRTKLAEPLRHAIELMTQAGFKIENLLDKPRNASNTMHGAVARSDTAQLRWRRLIDVAEPIQIRSLSLIVSDEAMGNPAAADEANCLHIDWDR